MADLGTIKIMTPSLASFIMPNLVYSPEMMLGTYFGSFKLLSNPLSTDNRFIITHFGIAGTMADAAPATPSATTGQLYPLVVG